MTTDMAAQPVDEYHERVPERPNPWFTDGEASRYVELCAEIDELIERNIAHGYE